MGETSIDAPATHVRVRERKKKSLGRRMNKKVKRLVRKPWFYYVLIAIAAVIIGYIFLDVDLTVDRRGRKVDAAPPPFASVVPEHFSV